MLGLNPKFPKSIKQTINYELLKNQAHGWRKLARKPQTLTPVTFNLVGITAHAGTNKSALVQAVWFSVSAHKTRAQEHFCPWVVSGKLLKIQARICGKLKVCVLSGWTHPSRLMHGATTWHLCLLNGTQRHIPYSETRGC